MIIGSKKRHRSRTAMGLSDGGMQWQQFNLSDGVELSNTGLTSATQDMSTGIWSVQLSSGDTTKIGSGALWGFKIPRRFRWSDLNFAAISIEKTGGTDVSGSDAYVFAGICPQPNATFNTAAAAGYMQDSTTSSQLDVGVLLGYADSSNPSYSAAQADVKGVFGSFFVGPGDKLMNATAVAVSAYGDPDTYKAVKRATGTVSITGDDDDFGFFIACGRDGSNAGNPILQFRAHYLVSGTNDSFFPNNDG